MNISSGYRKHGFDAYGGKVLVREDMNNWMSSPMRVDPAGICFELGQSIEEVEAGFFLLLPTITELIILNPNCNIIMSEETLRLFRKNSVILRGEYDSTAEKLAKDYGLRFLHSNIELATSGEYNSPEGFDRITLCFRQDASAYIHEDNAAPAASSDWIGGNERTVDLPEDFYVSMSLEQIADKCWSTKRSEAIKTNGILSALLKKAQEKNGVMINYLLFSQMK